jgi:hypothetical protein
LYVASATHAYLAGRTLTHATIGFQGSHALFTAGGDDLAFFVDSGGNDGFVGDPVNSYMFGTDNFGSTFFNSEQGADEVVALSAVGGADTAYQFAPERNTLSGFELVLPDGSSLGTVPGTLPALILDPFSSTLYLNGTNGDDFIEVSGRETRLNTFPFFIASFDVAVNGQSRNFQSFGATPTPIVFPTRFFVNGFDGTDSLVYDAIVPGATAKTRPETAFLGPGGGVVRQTDRLTGTTSDFTTIQGVEINYFYGTSADSALLSDSVGSDGFVSYVENGIPQAYISGPGHFVYASGVTSIGGYSVNGGNDWAVHYDSPFNDVFVASGNAYSYMSGLLPSEDLSAPDRFFHAAVGFPTSYAYSRSGTDVAYFLDSVGNDAFYSSLPYAYMSGNGYFNIGVGFSLVFGQSFVGGLDFAYNFAPGKTILAGFGPRVFT